MTIWSILAQNTLPRPRCLLCDDVALRANLCHDCLAVLPVIGLSCRHCGAPSDASRAGCPECARMPRTWHAAACAFRYAFPVDHLLKRLKFRGALEAALGLGEAAAVVLARQRPRRVDAVVPVPLHWRREWWRGFNQAIELARPVCRSLGLPLRPDLLARPVATREQSRIGEAERLANPRGAFEARGRVRGARLVLFDDVLTTGATAGAAAAALIEAGAREVRLWACARAVGGVRPSECGSSGRRRSCRDPR